ncbi:MAG: adenosine kinase [Bacteroidales bacterium]|nr:adenosine kinase [Bacteroidales bacterium]
MKRVLGLGNALVDVLIRLQNDDILIQYELPRGSMILFPQDRAEELTASVSDMKREIASGGSAANTLHGLARLGVETGFIGKTGKDEFGQVFENDLLKSGIESRLLTGSAGTGRAIALISPDSERTFAVYLGSAIELVPEDLESEVFSQYTHFHIEGYLVQNHALIKRAVELAKEKGLTVSLDLASFNVVKENREFLLELTKNYVDILFANEDEAYEFTLEKDPQKAASIIGDLCPLAIVKIGSQGSYIRHNGNTIHIPALKAECIDTTGAGDLFASGFMYGLSQNFSLENCAKAGTILGGNIIGVIGAKIPESRWQELRNRIQSL